MTTKQQYPPRIFNSRVKELREAHPSKPTIYTLAGLLGVTPITMQRIEEGIDLKLSNALQLAEYFNVPIQQLWETRN